jgi:hypothetical protein
MTAPTPRRIFMLSPVGADGLCSGCGKKPTRETGRCLCIGGPATRTLDAARATLDVERLAAAMNDAQIDPAELHLGRDLRIPAARIIAALEVTDGNGS